jgi:hypothetical protein
MYVQNFAEIERDMKNFNIHHLNKIKDQYNTNCKIINTVLWI